MVKSCACLCRLCYHWRLRWMRGKWASIVKKPAQLHNFHSYGVDKTSTSFGREINRHIARCTSPTSVVLHNKLVSDGGLQKWRPAPTSGSKTPGNWNRTTFLRWGELLITMCQYTTVYLNNWIMSYTHWAQDMLQQSVWYNGTNADAR